MTLFKINFRRHAQSLALLSPLLLHSGLTLAAPAANNTANSSSPNVAIQMLDTMEDAFKSLLAAANKNNDPKICDKPIPPEAGKNRLAIKIIEHCNGAIPTLGAK